MADKLEPPKSKAEMVQEALAELGMDAPLADVRDYIAKHYKETISEPSVWKVRKDLKAAIAAKSGATPTAPKPVKTPTTVKKVSALAAPKPTPVATAPAVTPTMSFGEVPAMIEAAKHFIAKCGGDRAAASKILEVV